MPPAERPARLAALTPAFLADLRYWITADPRILERILRLLDETVRDPAHGIGKPELLKHIGPNHWSRRITGEHRLVYRVERDHIVFLRARHHY
ncbi:MAG: Txe/YoeB family addiction module toxin [Chloroflexota bacterium]